MSDPYREATRHDRGMSPVAKIVLIAGGLFVTLVTALVLVGLFVAKRISDEIGDFGEEPVATLANMMDRLGADVSVVSSSEDEGQVVLRVGGGELVTLDISESAERDQEAAEPSVRFDGEAGRGGGVLRLDTEEGRTTVELRGGEDGGFLDISTPGHELRFGAGTGSSALPDWIPLYPGAELGKRQFSAAVDNGSLGGAVYRSDATPDEIFEWYREALDGHVTSHSFVGVGADGVEKASIEASAWEDDTRELTLHIATDDDGRSVLAIAYRSGEL